MIESVCITGGTGSIGRELVNLYLRQKDIKCVTVLSRDETKQEAMAREFRDSRLRFVLGDVRDERSLYEAFSGSDLVIHAAALKRVVGGEEYPEEYIKTNVDGAVNVCKACVVCGVKKGLLLSTDKAVAPVNLYGCSKMMGEKIFLKWNSSPTDFAVIRYGNILGSNGSVAEKWKSDPNSYVVDAHRFWLKKERAAELIQYVSEIFKGGEIAIAKTFSSDVKLLYNYVSVGKATTYGNLLKGERKCEYLMSEHESGVFFEDGDVMWLLPEGEESEHFKEYERVFKKPHSPFNYDSYTNFLRLRSDSEFHEAVGDAIPR